LDARLLRFAKKSQEITRKKQKEMLHENEQALRKGQLLRSEGKKAG
jgi:hypothetical protein